MDFIEFEAKYFNKLENNIWEVIKNYCYLHRFWIEHSFGLSRNYTTAILTAIKTNWNYK